MITSGLRARALAVLAGSLVALTLAGSALAGTPAPPATSGSTVADSVCAAQRRAARQNPTVANLKALGDCEIERRFATLRRLEGAVIAAPFLTAPDRRALLGKIQATHDGLASLKAKIDADTTVAELKVDLPRIATDYRVYLLLVPQVHLVRGSDAIGAAAERLTALAGRLQQLIDYARSQGKDVTAAQAALDSMEHNVAQAKTQVSGLSAKLLALTPPDWNDGTARPILEAARSAERTAHLELDAARADARAVIAALK